MKSGTRERRIPASFASSLPSYPTRLVGRETEREQLEDLLLQPEVRLVTVTGLPGIGKSRLATDVAARLKQGFEDAVVFVDLSPISAPTAVLPHVAHALSVPPGRHRPLEERLAAALERRRLLLVLDNCEHVSGATAHMVQMLSTCAQVTVLATSRERLHLSWEREFPIPPLRMPDRTSARDPEGLLRSPAVALFVERAQAVQPSFHLTALNGEAVAEICIRLGGIPLAIELAAARVKVLTPFQIAAHLQQQLHLLAAGTRDFPARHRTMRAAIVWSYDLLTPAEQALLRRLSVFAGGWDLDAAIAVGSALDCDVFEVMASLVDKSLVMRPDRPDGEARFNTVDSIRQFAAELLDAAKETSLVRGAHAAHFAAVAERIEQQFGTDAEERAIAPLAVEQANLHTALEWAMDHGDLATGLRLVAALGWLWYARGDLGEGRAEIERVISAAGAASDQRGLQAALIPAGILAWADGDYERARLHLTASLRRGQKGGERRRVVLANAFLGNVARAVGDYDRAVALHEQCLTEFQALGNPHGAAWAVYDLGLVERDRGAENAARRYFDESRRRFRELKYDWAVAWASWNLGGLVLRSGDVEGAASLYTESLILYQASQDRRGIAQSLEGLAKVAAQNGAWGETVQLLGAAENLRKTVGVRLTHAEQAEYNQLVGTAEVELGARDRIRLWSAGQGLSVDAAVQTGLEVTRHRPGVPPPSGRSGQLTVREREVAVLVAQGRSNREIGAVLGVTEKTAANHVQNIMNKLGVGRRAEIAAWTVARGLHRPPPPGGPRPTS